VNVSQLGGFKVAASTTKKAKITALRSIQSSRSPKRGALNTSHREEVEGDGRDDNSSRLRDPKARTNNTLGALSR
jgi:hypothetical protein